MDNAEFKDHAYKSRTKMAQEVAEILYCLLHGHPLDDLVTDLKHRAIHLDEKIQRHVLEFSEQVHFQIAYDPWHKITEDVRRSADHLLHDLGFKTH